VKKSEKILLGLFAALFLILIGGGGLLYGYNNYMSIREDNETLQSRLDDMNLALSQGAEWAHKYEWLEDNVPNYTSSKDASGRMLETIVNEAGKHGVSIGGREILEQTQVLGPDGLPLEEDLSYFDHAAVKIMVTGAQEKEFYAWLDALQKPTSFLGITRMQINPSGTNKTINAEVEFTQFYRAKAIPKVTKAN
jgi:hypothetical protein